MGYPKPLTTWRELMAHTLRAAAFLALVAVSSMVWVVFRTVDQVQDSDRAVVHTQEVLTAIETVLSTLVDAASAAPDMGSVGAPGDEQLDRADRSIDTDVTRLVTLTFDNPNQQANVRQLREHATRMIAALRAQSDARRAARAVSPADAETARASMDAVRATVRTMRTEENRLLADRVQAGHIAGRRLQLVTFRPRRGGGRTAWGDWLARRACGPISTAG
jgi:CHASE3 domain sensor protein